MESDRKQGGDNIWLIKITYCAGMYSIYPVWQIVQQRENEVEYMIDMKIEKEECGIMDKHKNVQKKLQPGDANMKNDRYEKINMEKAGIKILLEFPEKSKQEVIAQEVKSILSGELQEYIRQNVS